ncbi:hypothetical protein NQ318_002293 [Aromia moschata]|uniref:Uncharacterized protein n=1 Tax=Aromia moschata TaxID=1265417 RepID=A0AAV8Z5L3_9CUCU|nr:hypothetical protein NQ318_002293 [Aromia moschata]
MVDGQRVLPDEAVPVLVGVQWQVFAIGRRHRMESRPETLEGFRLPVDNGRLRPLPQDVDVVGVRQAYKKQSCTKLFLVQLCLYLWSVSDDAFNSFNIKTLSTCKQQKSSVRPCAFFTWVPPSATVVVLVSMNSMSGQSSELLAYLVGMKPTASRPTEDVNGPSSFTAYRMAVFKLTSLLITRLMGWSMRNVTTVEMWSWSRRFAVDVSHFNFELLPTDAGRIMDHRYPLLLQMFFRPDAAQHQKLGRIYGTSGQYHLFLGQDRTPNAVSDVLDAVGPPRSGVDEHPCNVGVHGDVEVIPQPDGAQESLSGAAPRPPPHGVLKQRETGLLVAVHVAHVVAHLLGGLQEAYPEGRVVGAVLDRLISKK